MKSVKSAGSALLAAACLFAVSGCTSRGITITSVPEGAEVSINYRVVGNTPIRVAFNHYGTYRLELRKEKYQTLVREENIHPPAYGWDPGAFVADNLIPARLNDEIYVHFVMKPLEEEKTDKGALSERDALLERANLARPVAEDTGSRTGERIYVAKVTNPRTGEQVRIELGMAPEKKYTEGAAGTELAATGPEMPAKGILDKPAVLQSVVKEIKAMPPEGARLAGEYNVEVAQPATPQAPDAEKKATPSRVNRTPKNEELIYAEPPPLDKEAKSQKSKVESKK